MVALGSIFNADDHKPVDFEPIPNGDYKVVVKNTEDKKSKKGDRYIGVTLEVIDGPHKGRLLWENLNLWNKNETARKIAEGALSGMTTAIGKTVIQDTSELHNKPMIARVGQKKDDNGELRNIIRGYKPLNTQPAGTNATTSSDSSPPWERKA